jgi:nucleotide-binding universal stress UspA family protein
MSQSILVPLDGSAFAESALPPALAIARRTGATILLARVHDLMAPPMVTEAGFSDSLDKATRNKEIAYLDDVAGRLSKQSPVNVATALLDGEIAETLQQRASAIKADLVVMATHGRGTFARLWLGSVADEMVRCLPIPLLLVRPHEVPDLVHEPDLGRILLPLDGSALAEQILQPAAALAASTSAEITLLRVVKPALREEYLPEDGAAKREAIALKKQLDALQQKLIGEAQGYLGGVAARLRERGLRVQTCVVAAEQPAAAILEQASQRKASLIALETHGRRGLSRLLLGSVADKVIRQSPVPVLVQRPC